MALLKRSSQRDTTLGQLHRKTNRKALMHESLDSENPSPASEHSVKQILKLYAKENTPLVTYATDGGILTSKIYFFMLYRIKQK